MHENRCLGYLRKNYLGEEILGSIWGERYYYDMYQTGYIDEATMTLKQEGHIKISQPAASMVSEPYLKPIGLKRIWAGFNKFMAKPYGPPVFIAIPETAILAYNIYKGAYESTDELYGDVTKAATRVAGFSTAIKVIAKWGPKSFVTGSLVLIPVGEVIEDLADYNKFIHMEWRSGVVTGEFTDNDMALLDGYNYPSLYRAWFSLLDAKAQEKNQLLRGFYPYGNRQVIEYAFVEAAYDRWMKAEGKDADDAVQANYKTGLRTKADHYGRIYEENILNPIFDGLCWYNKASPFGADTYGSFTDRGYRIGKFCRDYPYPQYTNAAGPAPVAVHTDILDDKELYDTLVQGMYDTWEKWNKGNTEVNPISEYLGHDVPIENIQQFALQQIQDMIDLFKTKEDGYNAANPDGLYPEVSTARATVWPIATSHLLYAPLPRWLEENLVPDYDLDTINWIDTRTAANSLNTLRSLLETTDFESLGYFTTSVVNSGFENISDEYADVRSYLVYPLASGETAPTTLALPDDDIFSGIRYHWEVEAHNQVAGYSLPSEGWSLIGKD